MLLVNNRVSAYTTVTFTNSTNTAIPDGVYNGSLASMAGLAVNVSGVPANAIITNMRIVTAVNHTWVGDLVFKLKSPDLAVLGIMSRPGYSEPADDGSGGFGLGGSLIATLACYIFRHGNL